MKIVIDIKTNVCQILIKNLQFFLEEMNTIRVSNLSEDVSEQELRDLFGECGYMSRCFVAYDHDTGTHHLY